MYNSLNKHIGYHLLLRLEHVLSAHEVDCILEADVFHGEFVEHSVVCWDGALSQRQGRHEVLQNLKVVFSFIHDPLIFVFKLNWSESLGDLAELGAGHLLGKFIKWWVQIVLDLKLWVLLLSRLLVQGALFRLIPLLVRVPKSDFLLHFQLSFFEVLLALFLRGVRGPLLRNAFDKVVVTLTWGRFKFDESIINSARIIWLTDDEIGLAILVFAALQTRMVLAVRIALDIKYLELSILTGGGSIHKGLIEFPDGVLEQLLPLFTLEHLYYFIFLLLINEFRRDVPIWRLAGSLAFGIIRGGSTLLGSKDVESDFFVWGRHLNILLNFVNWNLANFIWTNHILLVSILVWDEIIFR